MMGIVGALFAFVGRQVGRIANVIFGWATIMLFGKVPQEKQTWLSAVGLGAVIWLITLIGVIFPRVGTMLIAFVPSPRWVPISALRLLMLIAVFILPLLVGAIASLLLVPERKKGWELERSIVRGYPYTIALAVTLVLMIVFVPFLKIPSILRRWQDQHMAVMVKPDKYATVIDDIKKALANGGLETREEPASWLLRLPPRILGLAAGGSVAVMVADHLTVLRSSKRDFELIVYPSDLMIRGEEKAATMAKAAVSRELIFTDTYLTWTKEANDLEDRIRALWRSLQGKNAVELGSSEIHQLQEIEKELNSLKVSFDQWIVLYREKLQVEERLLEAMAGLSERPVAPSESAEAAQGKTRMMKAGLGITLPMPVTRKLIAAGAAVIVTSIMAWFIFFADIGHQQK